MYFPTNILLCFFLFPLVFIHEFGHAFAAKLLGFKVLGITIGGGKKRVETVLYGINLQINTYPTHGVTRMIPRGARLTRLKLWLSVLGGPMNIYRIDAAARHAPASWRSVKRCREISPPPMNGWRKRETNLLRMRRFGSRKKRSRH